MKKILPIIACCFFAYSATAQGYHITLQSNYHSGIAYLTYHMGKNLMLQDSAAVGSNGTATFNSTQKIPGGIYAVVFPGKSSLQIFSWTGKERS